MLTALYSLFSPERPGQVERPVLEVLRDGSVYVAFPLQVFGRAELVPDAAVFDRHDLLSAPSNAGLKPQRQVCSYRERFGTAPAASLRTPA